LEGVTEGTRSGTLAAPVSAPLLTANDLREALAAIHVSAPVHEEGEIASTNTLALELADTGTPEWTLVSAAHQTAGRGRHGRSWIDVPGRALMVSVVLRPTIRPPRAGLLSLLAGASLAQAIRDETGRAASCKWPNDVRVDGAKVAGVLVESRVVDERLAALVIGVGLNLEAPRGVADAAGVGDAAPRSLLVTFVRHLHAGYSGPDADLPERVRAAWLPLADTIGREVDATATTGETVHGRAVGIDAFGGLLVSTDSGERVVGFGEVATLA
jgi:BirA family biotin operon repressor/biotin-[acetyl-CoA-carboxylase] ligase